MCFFGFCRSLEMLIDYQNHLGIFSTTGWSAIWWIGKIKSLIKIKSIWCRICINLLASLWMDNGDSIRFDDRIIKKRWLLGPNHRKCGCFFNDFCFSYQLF